MAWGIDKRLQIISNIMLSNIVIPRGIGRVFPRVSGNPLNFGHTARDLLRYINA